MNDRLRQVDLGKAESTYIDLQPALRLIPIGVFSAIIACPLALVKLLILTPGIDPPQILPFPFRFWAVLIVLLGVTYSVISYSLLFFLWRLSRLLGCLVIATGAIIVISIAFMIISNIPEDASFVDYLEFIDDEMLFSLLAVAPMLIAITFASLIGYRILRADGEVRLLCAECTSGLFSQRSLVSGIDLPLSILNGWRWRALAFFFLSALCLATAVYLAIFVYSDALGLVALWIINQPINLVFELMMLGGAAGAVLIALAAVGRFRQAGRQRIHVSLSEAIDKDPRKPILFLRSFRDDQVLMRSPRLWWFGRLLEGGSLTNLDSILLEQGTPYGPVVALGDPSDPIPKYGSARGYFTTSEWQVGVTRLAEVAAAIVICLDDTDNIFWEVNELLSGPHVTKTLFLVNPKFSNDGTGQRLIERVVASLGRNKSFAINPIALPPTPLGFFVGENGQLNVIKSPSFSGVAYLIAIRWFMRVHFEKMTLPAR